MARSRTTYPKGKSGNPNGRPAKGESFEAIIKKWAEKSPEEVLKYIGASSLFAKEFQKMPKKVQLKELAVLSRFASAIGGSSRAWDSVVDRVEGKVPEKMIAGVANIPVELFEDILNEVYKKPV